MPAIKTSSIAYGTKVNTNNLAIIATLENCPNAIIIEAVTIWAETVSINI